MLLSNSFLVEFHDDTVSQIKEVEQLQFLRSCKLEQEECYKSLRLSFRGTPGGDGGGTAHPQHSRTAPTTETRELLLLFDDSKSVPETMPRVFNRWNTLFADSISAQKARRGLSGSALDLCVRSFVRSFVRSLCWNCMQTHAYMCAYVCGWLFFLVTRLPLA